MNRSIAAALALLAGTAFAQPAPSTGPVPTWPTKAVRILVGSPPGGPSDITARVFADQLSRRTGQPAVVENRPGAGNNLAAGVVAKSEADGHTLVLSPDTVLTVNPLVYRTQNFDARNDLVSASVLTSFTQMLVCNPKVGVKTMDELVAKAKADRMTYASGGPGVPGHLAAEMFLQAPDRGRAREGRQAARAGRVVRDAVAPGPRRAHARQGAQPA